MTSLKENKRRMANRWGISREVEELVKLRDKKCVYCGILFDPTCRKSKPSWEHIINDININGIHNITLCCISCNASKGARNLDDWLKSKYCLKRNITEITVAEVVQKAIIKSNQEKV